MSLMSGSLSVTANSILVDGAGTQSVGNTARMIPRHPIHQTISTLADAPHFVSFRRLHRISIFPHQRRQLIHAHSAPSKQAVGCLRFLESL
ncbi:hypothetical protein EGT47_08860 [Burkholderia cenocepacia]|nr:hypothetical protein EGT47_08860 [Burkholderia cenocepacia]